MGEVKMKLTEEEAQEVQHKLGVLADTPDLQEDYGLSQAQADQLRDSVPESGLWIIPDWAVSAVIGEMQDHAVVLRHIASDARSDGAAGQSLKIHRQAKKFEESFQ
jgi:hypothetical protein